MEASVCIEQKGIVEEVLDHKIRVRLQRESVCGHCNAQGICNISDGTERTFEMNDSRFDLKVGDQVGITISRSMGNKAVVLGYLVPFLLLITVLIVLNTAGIHELVSGFVSVAAIGIYYSLLYLVRNKLRRTFDFTVRKTFS